LYMEQAYDDLYRYLTDQPKTIKPELGKIRPVPAHERASAFRKMVWNVPFARNPFFTGREDVLEKLHTALASENAAALTPTPQAISGMGGIGKTQTAVEYAYRHREDYSAVFWTWADDASTLATGFKEIACLLDLPQSAGDQRETATAVKQWLEDHDGWLLIFDNADDLAVVHDFLPAQHRGCILLTTRLAATGGIARPVRMDKMPTEDGALLLLRRARCIDENSGLESAEPTERYAAFAISHEVDGLPLALDQAGAFIEETCCSPTEYLRLYQAEGKELRRRRGNLGEHDHGSVTITFTLAFTKLAAANPAAAELLRLCAFLAPDDIPEAILVQGASELGKILRSVAGNDLRRIQAIGEASRLSLLQRNPDTGTLNIHRLVQAVLRDGMPKKMQRLWAERAVRAVNRAFPVPCHIPGASSLLRGASNWEYCVRLFPQLSICKELIRQWGIKSPAAKDLISKEIQYLDQKRRNDNYWEQWNLYGHLWE
jgi:NB-ARC domain